MVVRCQPRSHVAATDGGGVWAAMPCGDAALNSASAVETTAMVARASAVAVSAEANCRVLRILNPKLSFALTVTISAAIGGRE